MPGRCTVLSKCSLLIRRIRKARIINLPRQSSPGRKQRAEGRAGRRGGAGCGGGGQRRPAGWRSQVQPRGAWFPIQLREESLRNQREDCSSCDFACHQFPSGGMGCEPRAEGGHLESPSVLHILLCLQNCCLPACRPPSGKLGLSWRGNINDSIFNRVPLQGLACDMHF